MTTAVRKTRMAVAGAAAALFLAVLLSPALAAAQEFQKVEGRLADEIPAVPFVGYAYGFIWVAVLAYVVYVARGLNRVNSEVDELRRKLDGGGAAATREASRR
ncbi:MAG TPA: CcmD family protein [Polyangia bacterium]|nr:CcmD family protein [Polyangia bacterium]